MNYPLDEWVGLEEERFMRYRNWRTTKGYLCGTTASGVLLAYYQDYLDEKMVPSFLRRKNSANGKVLLAFLQVLIQPVDLPTLAPQVSHGLTRYFDHFDLPYRGRATMAGGWYRAVKRIQAGKPVVLGLMRAKGSTYGNHWVTAYAFKETSDGKRYFKVHDNWGKYNQVIPAQWVSGTVSLP